VRISNEEFNEFVNRFERKSNINEILSFYDNKILGDVLKLSLREIEIIQGIRQKLVDKRMR